MTSLASSRLRFHWSLPGATTKGSVVAGVARDSTADLASQLEFCRRGDELGIDSILLPIGYQRPDPVTLAGAFGAATEKVAFMVAARSGVVSPTYFVQQINTVSALTGGRVSVNVVIGHTSAELRYYGDFLDREERYRRTNEFWTVCDALWRQEFPVNFAGEFLKVEGATINNQFVSPDRSRPEVYFSGSSQQAVQITLAHGDSLLSIAEPPDELAQHIRPALDGGASVTVVCTQVCRPTREEAVREANDLAEAAAERNRNATRHHFNRDKVESEGFTRAYELSERKSLWAAPYLWSGLVAHMGPPAVALVGGPDEIVDAIFEYRDVGVSQFLFKGHPDLETLIFFGEEILPRIRRREQSEQLRTAPSAGEDGHHG